VRSAHRGGPDPAEFGINHLGLYRNCSPIRPVCLPWARQPLAVGPAISGVEQLKLCSGRALQPLVASCSASSQETRRTAKAGLSLAPLASSSIGHWHKQGLTVHWSMSLRRCANRETRAGSSPGAPTKPASWGGSWWSS
jgi:hypothetical protein